MNCDIEIKCKDCIYYRYETIRCGGGEIGFVNWCELGNAPNIDGCEDYKE